jgi:hypothetical protein
VSLLLQEIGMADRLLAYTDSEGKLRLVDGHLRRDILGDTLVPVLVTDLTEEEAAMMVAVGDPLAGLAERDDAVMAELLQQTDGDLLAQLLEGNDQLSALLGVGAEEPSGGLLPDADPDAIPEEVETRCQAGELWALGEHRLGCLDGMDRASYERLLADIRPDVIYADPPYGVAVQISDGKMHGKAWGLRNSFKPITGDESTTTAMESAKLLLSLFPAAAHVWWGGNHYASVLPDSSCWLVWDKETGSNDFGDAELAWTNQKTAVRLFRHQWSGMLKASEHGERRVHPTQKPVALACWCLEKYAGHVLDPFLGSGTTLIAAESLGRRCFGMEVEPGYCDVVLARWEQATGKQAVRLEAG